MLRWRHLAQTQAFGEAEGGQEAYEDGRQRRDTPGSVYGGAVFRRLDEGAGSFPASRDEVSRAVWRYPCNSTRDWIITVIQSPRVSLLFTQLPCLRQPSPNPHKSRNSLICFSNLSPAYL